MHSAIIFLKSKFKLFAFIALASGALTTVYFFYEHAALITKNKSQPNIIILSFCSLRFADLESSPVFKKFKSESYFFTQAFSKHSWINLFQYLYNEINPLFLKSQGYELVGEHPDWPFTLIPQGNESAATYEHLNENFNLDFKSGLADIKSKILAQHSKPFYMFIHFRYLHYPLIDHLNKNTHWDIFLNADEKLYVDEVLKNPSKHKDKLPMLLMLSGSSDILKNFNEIQFQGLKKSEQFLKQYALFNDSYYLARWQNSIDYEKDILILHKIYQAKLKYFGDQISELINLYDNSDLQKNTLQIITGDHGESLMEHGSLGHSFNVFDETLHVPLMIQFPKKNITAEKILTDQFFIGSLTHFLREVIGGSSASKLLLDQTVHLTSNETLVLRNCAKTEFGLRYKNEWKYIKKYNSEGSMLFNLKTDPQELINVIKSNSETAANFELLLNQHINDLNQAIDQSSCL